MSLSIIFFSSFIIALSGALVPGPLFSITVAESVKRGSVAGPLIIVGHGILELALVILLVLGITPLLTSPATRAAVSIAGGLVLIYMGGSLIKEGRTAHLSASGSAGSKGVNPILSGIVGSVSNPYWSIWWLTIGVGYLMSSLKFGLLGITSFFVGHIAADLGWYSLVSLAAAKGKRLMGDGGYRFLLYFCGVVLVLFGAWFLKGI
jgi:threonine/homoserine/homoserine lactone efflux protein